MKKGYSVRRSKHPRYKFVVRGKFGGKPTVNYFTSKAEAESFAQLKNTELMNVGREGAEFPSALRVMALEAQAILTPLGLTILDAAKHVATAEGNRRKSTEIGKLVGELADHRKAEGKSRAWITQIRTEGGKFASRFTGKMVSEITTRNIQEYFNGLLDLHPVSYNHIRAIILSLFSYAKRMGYCTENPVENIAKRKAKDTAPGIVSVEQAGFILRNAPPELVPYFAIALFAGIRTAELKRADWSEVDLEAGLIEVPASKSKTAMRRLVKIEPCLAAWLRPYKREAGPIVPKTFAMRFRLFLRSYPQLPAWPKNAARHSFCSYHLAHFTDAAKLALEMGHTTTKLIFQHYRNLVRPADAERYWQLFPPAGEQVEKMRVRPAKAIPPYSIHMRQYKGGNRVDRFVLWMKDGKIRRKFFDKESEAIKWMVEKNAPWYEGKDVEEADERFPRELARTARVDSVMAV